MRKIRNCGSRRWEYMLGDIAVASGVSIHTVRLHHRGGRFRAGDLVSVSEYVVGSRLLRKRRLESR